MAKVVAERGDVRSTQDLDRKVSVSPAQARQGPKGQRVLMVLVGGLVLVALAWGAAAIFGERTDNDAATDVQQMQTAPADNAMPSSQRTIDNTPANGEQMQPAPVDKDPTPQTGTTNG